MSPFAETAAAAPAIDPTVLVLLSIFGGAALTVIAGFIGAAIQNQREHSRWVRERRLESYAQAEGYLWEKFRSRVILTDLNDRITELQQGTVDGEPVDENRRRSEFRRLGKELALVSDRRERLDANHPHKLGSFAILVPPKVWTLWDRAWNSESMEVDELNAEMEGVAAAMRESLGIKD